MELRPYQHQLKSDIYDQWAMQYRYIMGVLPTGGGKTVIFSDILKEHPGASCAIAHRQELVGQISQALARDDVKHRIIGPKSVIKLVVNNHMDEFGRSYYDPGAPCGVAGVDTIIRRGVELERWLKSVTLWVQDEAHHVLKKNKWGKAAAMFPNARGLGVTATPMRADGQGLGHHADGLFQSMVVGPTMRELINMGYLSDYRIFAPPCDIDLKPVPVSSTTGDFNPHKLKIAVRKSHIVGDVVKHYLRIAPGKLGITFVSDVETATDVANQFNLNGVPAAVVSSKTPDHERNGILRNFRNKKLLQIVNVDILGEGFDVPGVEVVSMARPTKSYGLFVQQFGRALRILIGKDKAIIIDHVNNVINFAATHGLPDAPRTWSLDRRDKRAKTESDAIPMRVCINCSAAFERVLNQCPNCGLRPILQHRSSPEFVDGDLLELDAATLANMRGEIAKVDMHQEEYRKQLAEKYMPKIGQFANVKRHVVRQEAQQGLRNSIALWAGHQRAIDRADSESYKRFYFKFGIDVMSAQALNTKEANELMSKINEELQHV